MFGHFVEYIECANEIPTLGVDCDEGIEDGDGVGVEVALVEGGMELTVCGRSV